MTQDTCSSPRQSAAGTAATTNALFDWDNWIVRVAQKAGQRLYILQRVCEEASIVRLNGRRLLSSSDSPEVRSHGIRAQGVNVWEKNELNGVHRLASR